MKKIYLFFIVSLFTATVYSQSTTLVISQAYGGGGNGGSVYKNDFIEIFNKSSAPISLNGYSVQYASTTGSSWAVTPLTNVMLQPGQYYLIQEAVGAGGTTSLPSPDAIGTIAMGGTGFKVALVNTTSALSGTCPSSSSIIDFVGCSGTANCFEGATAPAPSNSNSISRKLNGCQDTQDNSSDFTAGLAAPRNTSTAVNPCSVSCTTPSQKPTSIRYGGSPTNTSMTVYFSRGNGTGSLVLCKQGSAVNAAPVNGTTYTTNTVFGSGSQIGTGNYAVFNTTYKDVNAFTLTGLTAGTKYYFSVFEYNDPGKCYTTTGLIDSFTVGATVLKPGDMAFVGWDNASNAGEDKLYIMNMVDLAEGTRFSLVNSRFEAGAAANVRTNRWYGGSTDPYDDPEMLDFEYVGTTIAKGSVISMESNSSSGFTNFTINGASVPASDFTATTGFSNFLSTTGSDADQLYITQGKFTSYGSVGVDRYNLLSGLVIHGITTRTPWVPLTSAVSTGGGASRESRIPPDIFCFSVEFGSNTVGYGAYKHSAGIVGTKNQLLTNIKNTANWNFGAGANNVNDVLLNEPNANTAFTINTGNTDGQWLGNSGDWFDCNNWEGLHVPDSTTDALLNTNVTPFSPNINITTSPYAVQYSNIAHANNITVPITSSMAVSGPGNEKLVVEGNINVSLSSNLSFENNSNAANDTLWVHNSITDSNPSLGLGIIFGQATVVLDEARTNITPYGLNKNITGEYSIYKLAVNNTRSTNINNKVRVTNNLNLQNGYLTVTPSTGSFTLSSTATVTSPANIYGQNNKGYFSSFVNGKMFYDADASSVNMVFPIGKYGGTDTAFAPVELTKTNTTATTYDAEYFPAAYSDLSVDIVQLDHVSRVEHWLINSSAGGADAKVTLSWRPKSYVGDGTSNPTSFDSLMVAHYFDPGTGTPLWSVDGGSAVIMPKNSGYSFNYGLITTVVSTGSFSPFTLGTRGLYNSLPLKMLSFTGAIAAGKTKLQWLTAEEQSVDRYEVEKSTDGIHFQYLNSVGSLNVTGHHTYNSLDNSPVQGWNFYRLRIIDKAARISFSTIIKLWYGKTTDLLVYPNPASTEIKINLPASSSISQIQIVNSGGRVVKQLATSEQSFTINIESLSKGMYFIRILNSRQAIAQKFTKQ
jgi:hypothetical protein